VKREYSNAAVLASKSSHEENANSLVATNDAGAQLTTIEPNERGHEKCSRSRRKYIYGPWNERLQGVSQLDFESNLTLVTDTPKMLDPDRYGDDMKLWALLLDHRNRKFGTKGVRMFWEEIRSRNVQLPVTSSLAEQMWHTFLLLGFEDSLVLEQICQYADDQYSSQGIRWTKLYLRIVQHFLVNGTGEEAINWHERLITEHPPGPTGFVEMCRAVVSLHGNTVALQRIYQDYGHRKAYSKVVGVLCEQEKFDAALKWHMFFMEHGDFPTSIVVIERLVQYLAAYDTPNAIKVTQSIVDAGVPFSSRLAANLEISREMMNLVHGHHFQIKPLSYKDELGARWLATRWVSLDVAISSIHALGIQGIGPLSLQAIALREPDVKDLRKRLAQLRDLGISLGYSLYSRAVAKFARAGDHAHLESLLQSDQHPDALEDAQLQENLLSTYVQNKDWTQFRRTLAIQQLRGKSSPEYSKQNLILRVHARRQHAEALQRTLELMRQKGTSVSASAMFEIVRCFLVPRQRSKRPASMDTRDIDFVVFILKSLAYSGSHVPPTIWREILRRLGMLGRLSELKNLSLFLAFWYSPNNTSTSVGKHGIQHRLLTQLALTHPLHPLNIIFPVSFQKAAVEWGFIHALNRKAIDVATSRFNLDVTFGLRLLHELFTQGVHIDLKAVGKVIRHRLLIYYGPGSSARLYNRRARLNLRLRYGRSELSYEAIVLQIKAVTGADTYSTFEIPQLATLRSGKLLEVRQTRKRVLARVASR
jgi:hypothetical protein